MVHMRRQHEAGTSAQPQQPRLPHIAVFSSLFGAAKQAKPGGPPQRLEKCVGAELQQLGISGLDWQAECCRMGRGHGSSHILGALLGLSCGLGGRANSPLCQAEQGTTWLVGCVAALMLERGAPLPHLVEEALARTWLSP